MAGRAGILAFSMVAIAPTVYGDSFCGAGKSLAYAGKDAKNMGCMMALPVSTTPAKEYSGSERRRRAAGTAGLCENKCCEAESYTCSNWAGTNTKNNVFKCKTGRVMDQTKADTALDREYNFDTTCCKAASCSDLGAGAKGEIKAWDCRNQQLTTDPAAGKYDMIFDKSKASTACSGDKCKLGAADSTFPSTCCKAPTCEERKPCSMYKAEAACEAAEGCGWDNDDNEDEGGKAANRCVKSQNNGRSATDTCTTLDKMYDSAKDATKIATKFDTDCCTADATCEHLAMNMGSKCAKEKKYDSAKATTKATKANFEATCCTALGKTCHTFGSPTTAGFAVATDNTMYSCDPATKGFDMTAKDKAVTDEASFKTTCCKALLTCTDHKCSAGYKKKATLPTNCGSVTKCSDNVCCEKDKTTCLGAVGEEDSVTDNTITPLPKLACDSKSIWTWDKSVYGTKIGALTMENFRKKCCTKRRETCDTFQQAKPASGALSQSLSAFIAVVAVLVVGKNF